MKRLPRSNGDPVVLDGKVWDRLADQVERDSNLTITSPLTLVETTTGRTLGIQIGFEPFRAKIKTAADSNGIAVVNLYDGTNTGSTDFPVKIVSHRAANELIVAVRVSPDTGATLGGLPVPYIEVATNVLFPVVVAQNGGSAGSASAYCSYTYDVKDVAGSITLGTAIAVQSARPFKAQCITAGVIGAAYIGSDGTVKLLSVDEQFKTTVC